MRYGKSKPKVRTYSKKKVRARPKGKKAKR